MTKETGGPAFPEVFTDFDMNNNRHDTYSTGGMALRDYFAAKAMQAMLCADTDNGKFRDEEARTAAFAYRVADAMLAERSKP